MLNTVFKKYLLVLVLYFGTSLQSWAQSGNLPYVDEKPFHFGFSLGLNSMDFGVKPSLVSVDGVIYNADVSTLKPGFSVGIISDMRLNRYFNLRFTPTLHLGERQLNYSIGDTPAGSTIVQSIPVSLPVYIKYSAERKNNYRPYLIWGGGAYINLGTNKENPVLLKPLDFYTEFGVGCDIYFSFFKLAPELKFAIGFNDMFVPLDKRDAGQILDADKRYSLALSKLTSRMITLSFNFE